MMLPTIRIALPTCDELPTIIDHFETAKLKIELADAMTSISDPFECGFDFEFVQLSSHDVCAYVEHGVAHAGVVGTDTLFETEVKVWRPLTFSFGRFPMILGARVGQTLARLREKSTVRLATRYPKFSRDWFSQRGFSTDIIVVENAPETAVQLGLADAFVDQLRDPDRLVSNGFRALDKLGETELKLVVNNATGSKRRAAIGKCIEELTRQMPAVGERIEIPFDIEDPI